MRKVLTLGLLVLVALSACSGSPPVQEVMEEEQPVTVTVYRSPT